MTLVAKVLALLGLISFGIAIGHQFGLQLFGTDSILGFYSPISRAWEFIAGALLALLGRGSASRSTSGILQMSGAIALAFGFMFATPASVPGYGAILPVLGTVLVIAGGKSQGPISNVLSANFLSRVGDLSYSLYLWHWPLIVWANYVWPSNWIASTIAVMVSFVISIASFRFVENPLRGVRPDPIKSKLHLVITIFLIPILFGSFGLLASQMVANPDNRIRATLNVGDLGQQIFHNHVNQEFFPCTPEDLFASSPQWEGVVRCHQSLPGSSPAIAIVGDSHAEQLFVGLAERYPHINFVYFIDGIPIEETSVRMAQILDYVSTQPEIKVVLATAFWRVGGVPAREFETTLRKLDVAGKKIFITNDVPDFSFDPAQCKFSASLLNNRAICDSIPEGFVDGGPTWNEALLSLQRSVPNVTLIDTYSHFCDSMKCSMAKGGYLLYRDSNHLNLNGSRYLANVIASDPSFRKTTMVFDQKL